MGPGLRWRAFGLLIEDNPPGPRNCDLRPESPASNIVQALTEEPSRGPWGPFDVERDTAPG